jgi:hypothetical protein
MNIKNKIIISSLIISSQVHAFCGFYVAKADAKLFNKSSQVIIARDGTHQVITMSNDFEGEVKDFAMVVPVPTVLKKDDIKVVEQSIFDMLDAYSGPRLVEYHDYNPCYNNRYKYKEGNIPQAASSMMDESVVKSVVEKKYNVKIEATYTVGEYDILVLSAKESGGLKGWLIDNGYKIPEKAEEVLEPYIKSNMKFFVVKVNLGEQKKNGSNKLRPLQISFESEKFMLPIRLGMANANGPQDLIIYGFARKGRIETTNYKTLKIPTDKNIPENLKPKFGEFYKDMFGNTYNQDKQATYLEYAWNLNGNNYTHCDPCAGTPPTMKQFQEAGVTWLKPAQPNQNDYGRLSEYDGEVFITRLHVRYDRQNFPQDLIFQETPNQENFQGRYIMQHALTEKLDCAEANNYYAGVNKRRNAEVEELKKLTGWSTSSYQNYVNEFSNYQEKKIQEQPEDPQKQQYQNATPPPPSKVLKKKSKKTRRHKSMMALELLVILGLMRGYAYYRRQGIGERS